MLKKTFNKDPPGIWSLVASSDKSRLRVGWTVTSDQSVDSVMQKGPTLHSLEHRCYPFYLVGAKQAGAADGRHHREEGLCAPHLLAKQVKGVWQGVADWPAQLPQAEALQAHLHLIGDRVAPSMLLP